MTDIFNLVKAYSDRIKNDRTVNDIFIHGSEEMNELDEELDKKANKQALGPDGVIGEAIDVISCMLDLLMKEDPTFTSNQFNEYLDKKCKKWGYKYGK